jgi:hypothetical protein
MKRNVSGWGVTLVGLLLAGLGGYAMSSGWDMILLERGWSLFIAGSVMLSGGVVTMALGRVVAQVSRLVALGPSAAKVEATESAAPAAPPPQVVAPPPPPRPEAAPAPEAVNPFLPREEPKEVDRYTAGDATYVMLSDGSVEVRSAAGSHRYSSLAALREEAESRQR